VFEDEYEVEAIIDERLLRGAKQYLVKWKGYGAVAASWTPANDRTHWAEALAEYEQAKCSHPPPLVIRTPTSTHYLSSRINLLTLSSSPPSHSQTHTFTPYTFVSSHF
jgi:hypothetical protein